MTNKNTLPTTAQCREFTLLLGVEWHESIRSDSLHEYCSCGAVLLNKRALNFHKATLNPTYDSAAILLPMRKKLGEVEFVDFMFEIGTVFYKNTGNAEYYIKLDYIFNPALLIGKAIEWMKEKRK